MRIATTAGLMLALSSAAIALTPENPPPASALTSNFLKPRQLEGGDPLANLKTPEGYKVEVFAKDLLNPRMMAVSETGVVYVTRRSVGDVVMIKIGPDGKAETPVVVASRDKMHGIAIKGSQMWLATVADVYIADIKADGTLGELQRIINDLPDAGQHPNRTMGFGPDGMLYISVGSTCNSCTESRAENATILQASPDGKQRRIFASGLRNTIGFDWRPGTSELYGWDQSFDFVGDEVPKEEINKIEDGKYYGWPYVMEDNKPNPIDAQDNTVKIAEWLEKSTPMALGYKAHSAGIQFAFAKSGEFAGDAFVALRGSWNAKPARGYEVVRIKFENGKPVKVIPFLTGFLQKADSNQPVVSGRPAGLAFLPDGSLLVGSDTSGVIYRITGPGFSSRREVASSGGALATEKVEPPHQLARELLKVSEGPLNVSSSDFAADQPISFKHSAFGENVSPQLTWSSPPKGTKSFAIIMEDPDAAQPKPFVHWIAYNIPADTASLKAGLSTPARLVEPKDMLQGANSTGATGYFGPKPPDEIIHHYHFQVFALDTKLDLPPGADRKATLDAMNGHVLSVGSLTGVFVKPASE